MGASSSVGYGPNVPQWVSYVASRTVSPLDTVRTCQRRGCPATRHPLVASRSHVHASFCHTGAHARRLWLVSNPRGRCTLTVLLIRGLIQSGLDSERGSERGLTPGFSRVPIALSPCLAEGGVDT
ncbi:hypothetical protein EXIGLDRAFT_728368 [Exidia glandulosa HHB12029]|uniref:Uncharacterized protein n=1 Tax=Exidia glandulosa HHB12029 TaxID=1314781 RepID=A0A165LV40_EXIGL|nr:hypothetical protein EXIGLDRAFT_728368 [Exidia glandulosa HHB12029]